MKLAEEQSGPLTMCGIFQTPRGTCFRIFARTALLALLLVSGAAQGFDSAPYSPFPGGAQWTYLRNGTETIVESVQGTRVINGVVTTVLGTADGDESYSVVDANGTFSYGGAVRSGAIAATFIPSTPMKLMDADATLGVTVSSSGAITLNIPDLGSFPFQYTLSSTPQAFETVTVPAGTFSTLRIASVLRMYGTVSGPGGSAELDLTVTNTAWLASGVGSIKTVTETADNGDPPVVDTEELTSLNFLPVLTFSSTSADWGSQPADGKPGHVLRGPMVTNNSPFTIHLSSAVTGEFALASGGDCAVLAPGQYCFISADFRPASVGGKTGALTITSDAIGSPFVYPLTGIGTGVGVATLTPNALDFGNQDRGVTSPAQTVTLTNTGSAALAISYIQTTGQYAQTTDCGASLAIGGSCQINVTFTPFGTGTVTGSLIVDTMSERLFVSVSGNGVGAAPPVSVAPARLSFGAQQIGTTSPVQTITVKNEGSSHLNIYSIGPDPANPLGDFGFTTSCPAVLAAGASCSGSVTFAPTAAGTRYGYLSIHTDGTPSGDYLLVFSGIGATGPVDTLPYSADLNAGWNLIGYGSSGTLDVPALFGDAAKVTTVWKWVASKSNWAFYAPGESDGGAAYASSRGYDFLASIGGGEGFWVNAKTGFTVQLPAGVALSSASFNNLPAGWNLIAVGDKPSASEFNKALSLASPAPGEIPLNLTTLWAWDALQANWYFYAPGLDQRGALAGYISAKGYLDFGTKLLEPATGFWVNRP